jgi:hypothetical protein
LAKRARPLRRLPLPYLTMNPTEVMFMDEQEPYQESMRTALEGGKDAEAQLMELACFQEGVLPYPPDVLYRVTGDNGDQARMDNCVAMDIGYANFWHQSEDSEDNHPELDLHVVAPGPPNLITLMDAIEGQAKMRARSAGTSLSFAPGSRPGAEQLKMLIYTETEAECEALKGDRTFRQTLDGALSDSLNEVCRNYGFSWLGFVIRSNDSVKKRFTGDYAIYNDWINAPVTKPLD